MQVSAAQSTESTATVAPDVEPAGGAGHPEGSAPRVSLGQLQQAMVAAVESAGSRRDVFADMASLVTKYTPTTALVYFFRDDTGTLMPLDNQPIDELQQALGVKTEHWTDWCQHACAQGQSEQFAVGQPVSAIVITVPVHLPDSEPEAFCAVFPGNQNPDGMSVVLLQIVASYMALWHIKSVSSDTEREAANLAALVEVVAKVHSAASLQHAAYTVTSELHDFLHCQRVALGILNGSSGDCRLLALSGMSEFDRHSPFVHAIEATLDEALIRGKLTHWPPQSDADKSASMAHRKLSAVADGSAIVSSPLRDESGDAVGAWLLLGDARLLQRPEITGFIRAADVPLGASLALLDDARQGPLTKFTQSLRRQARSRWLRWTLAAAAVIATVLLIPVPYKLTCDCVVEPVKRRYVAAPFDGSLEKSHVEPGDLVTADDVLATMDGREIRWELAGLEADYNRARKERDAAQANRKTSATQIARLDMEQFDLKIRLLKHRSGQLEVRSPIDGIVVTGDLERVEGAPLTVGQTLFEVAPLDNMIVEISIPEAEIAHFQRAMPVKITLDSYPGEDWTGEIRRIHPRTEMREQDSVFIAEVELKNEAEALRPGMNGQARITGNWKCLGWILFHRPIAHLNEMMGW